MSFLLGFIHRQLIYAPPIPTTSFKGRTVIVTGGNSGLGKEACRWLINLDASLVIIACRNAETGKAAEKDIQATTNCSADALQVWPLDMSSYASVVAFAERAKAELPRLDAFIANAGISTTHFRMSGEYEETINTNVISLFLQIFLLLPKLHETAIKYNTQTHITVTTSELYEVAKFKELELAPAGQIFEILSDKKKSNMFDRYKVSKLMQILVIKQMAAMYPLSQSNVIINGIAPGFCDTGLLRDGPALPIRIFKMLFARKAEVGSRTLVYGAGAGPETHGQYVPDCKITTTKGMTSGKEGAELQEKIWTELKKKLESIRPGVTSIQF